MHVYYFNTDLLKEDAIKYITSQEDEKASRFIHKKDKLNFLFGRSLAKQLVGRYLAVAPEKIFIEAGFNKKPLAKIEGSEHPSGIKFNLSHSHSCLLLAFSETEVGCDIETISETNYNDIINSCFTTRETKIITESKNPLQEFFKLWACKEAVLKTMGVGLIDDLKALEVCSEKNIIAAEELQFEKNFFLSQFQIEEKFAAAVCYIANERKNIFFFDGTNLLPNSV